MLKLFRKSKLSVGIQITDELVRFVSFDVSKNEIKTDVFGEEFLSGDVMHQGKITNPDKLTAVLETLRKKYKFKEVTVVLPEEQSFIFYTNVPHVETGELKDVIQDHISSYLHLHSKLSLRDLICEYDVIGQTEGNYEVQVTVTPQTLVETYIKVFEDAGLHPKTLEVGSHMVSQACVTDSDGSACMIVDFGEERTHISTVSEGKVMQSGTLLTGHNHLGPVIEKYLNINSHEAGRIKSKYGILRTHKEPQLLSEMLYELSPIRDYIDRKYVDWHKKEYKGKKERNPIQKIILHGEGAHLSGFAEHLATSTRIPVEHASVWGTVPGFQESIPKMYKNDTLRYATAISAALQGMKV